VHIFWLIQKELFLKHFSNEFKRFLMQNCLSNSLKLLKNVFEKYFIPFGHLKFENSGQKQVFFKWVYKNEGFFF
jgi:hypothetical protein